jgi:hypothetical protein
MQLVIKATHIFAKPTAFGNPHVFKLNLVLALLASLFKALWILHLPISNGGGGHLPPAWGILWEKKAIDYVLYRILRTFITKNYGAFPWDFVTLPNRTQNPYFCGKSAK